MKAVVTTLCIMLLGKSIVTCLARPSPAAVAAAAAPVAANAALPLGSTWFMQPFEQCGGTGGVCSAEASAGIHTCADKQYPGTICPMTYACQRQSEAFWQCLPAQLQAAAVSANATARGRNRTSAAAGSSIDDTYQPAQIENAGFRRYNISVWPYCAPWEYAIASRCVPAPNRTDDISANSTSLPVSRDSAGAGTLQGVWIPFVTAVAVALLSTALM